MINSLISGGVIVNYFCTSSCRHCLYNCGPKRSKNYMDHRTADYIFKNLATRGVGSVHIGGGEPMLQPDLLSRVLDAAGKARVYIEYVETNSSWYKDETAACRILERLRLKGLNTLLVSISPFHAEFIPFAKTLGVIDACKKTGIQIFPWKNTFTRDLLKLDIKTTHGLDALMDRFGPSYLSDIKNRYWVHMGGRALDTFRPLYEEKTVGQLLNDNPLPCAAELLDTSHFHVDLYKNYIPGLCSGLALDMDDIGRPVSDDKYPLLRLLLKKGISGLFDLAEGFGFSPARQGYLSKCDLCTEIRRFLFATDQFENELLPRGFYAGSVQTV